VRAKKTLVILTYPHRHPETAAIVILNSFQDLGRQRLI